MPTNLLHHGSQNRIQKTSRNMAARKGPRLYKKQSGTQREKKHVLTLTLMLVRRKSACKTSPGSSKILRWLTPLLGPNLDPKTGPKQRPKRRNENVIQFWTPFWGPYLDQKWGQPSENFAAARTCCASRFATLQLEHECQLIPFSLCASQVRLLLSRSLYRSHVLTTFLGPVFGAMMMKQVCWHSPCHCFLMLALLRPSRRTRQNRSRQQSAASGC